MASVLKMPALGQTVEEVRILQWFKAEGDPVEKGEPLAEVETDKVNITWESPASGVVRRLLEPVDAAVAVNAPVAIVGSADESIDDLLPGSSGAPSAGHEAASQPAAAAAASRTNGAAASAAGTPSAGERVFLSPRARRLADELGLDVTALAGRGTGPDGRVQEKDVTAFYEETRAAAQMAEQAGGRGPKSSPLARAVASGAGLDVAAVSGTGAGGRVTAEDVRQAAGERPDTPAAPATVSPSGGTRTITLTGLRKRVADNVARSARTAPHVTLNLSVDMTQAQRLRADLLPAVEKPPASACPRRILSSKPLPLRCATCPT